MIFAIGLSKTGITSLASALRLLGFRVKGFPRSVSVPAGYDGAVDTPVAAQFSEFDRRYPGSRFIYTTRAEEDWLDSCDHMWRRRQVAFDRDPFITQLHRRLYGTTRFSRDAFRAAGRRHADAVSRYFADRPRDLLVLDIAADQSPWRSLCSFLGIGEPPCPFPRDNTRAGIEQLILYVLNKTGDASRTAALTGAALPVLDDIAARHAGDRSSTLDVDALGNGWEVRRILEKIVAEQGSLTAASRWLKLRPDEIARILSSE